MLHRCTIGALLIGFMLVGKRSEAQDSGKLRLLIDSGGTFKVRVDGGPVQSVRELELTPGPHALRIWAPTRLVTDTNVVVVQDRMSDVIMKLSVDPDHTAYRMEMRSFQRKRRAWRLIPIGLTVGSGAWMLTALKKQNDAYDQLHEDRDSYGAASDPLVIARLKNEVLPARQDDLATARSRLTVASGVTIAMAACTVAAFWRSAKFKRPVFDDKQKLRFEGLAFAPSWQGEGGSIHLALTYR